MKEEKKESVQNVNNREPLDIDRLLITNKSNITRNMVIDDAIKTGRPIIMTYEIEQEDIIKRMNKK